VKSPERKNWFHDLDRLRVISIAFLILLLLAVGVFSGMRENKQLSHAERSESLGEAAEQKGEVIHFIGIDLEVIDNEAIRVTYTMQITSAGSRYFKGIAPGITSGHVYADGSQQTYTLEAIEALKDGEAEHFELKNHSETLKRLYIFNPEKDVSLGKHSYQISYLVRGAIIHMADHNLFTWHALHPVWSLPVKQLAMRIRFPQEVSLSTIESLPMLQGPDGAHREGSSRLEWENNGVLLWPKDESIKPYSHFFATVKWPK
jgi:hypothetical protein